MNSIGGLESYPLAAMSVATRSGQRPSLKATKFLARSSDGISPWYDLDQGKRHIEKPGLDICPSEEGPPCHYSNKTLLP